MFQHFIKRACTALSLSFISLLCTPVYAKFWDEFSITGSLAQHDFREYRVQSGGSSQFISQNYKATSPALKMAWDKEFSPRWHAKMVLDLYYDCSMDSENVLSNGRVSFDAHSWSGTLKTLFMYDTDPQAGVKVGTGIGVSNYALVTYISDDSEYTHHPNLMAPILRAEKHYWIWGMPASFSIEGSYLDFYLFDGQGYTLEHVLWIRRNSEVDQGISIQYHYWNLDQGKIFNHNWKRDFHGMSWGYELRFK